jgi:Xaa-Pro aminopeptidase
VGPDLLRLRTERHAKLTAQMEREGVDALLLLGTSPVQYAVGPATPAADASHHHLIRTAALVTADANPPHLFTPDPVAAPPELAEDHVHRAVHPDTEAGVADLVARVLDVLGGEAPGRLGIDELTAPMLTDLPKLLAGADLTDASTILGPAKIMKTVDELACIRQAQRINELAMYDVMDRLRPGVRQSELTGAFLRRIFELGATSNTVDPIWQVMPPRIGDGPFTTNGDVAFPLVTTDRILAEGDVVWVDTGISYHGYASDFGRTWLVSRDPRPTGHQRDQLARWRSVVDAVLDRVRPGATGRDLTAAAVEAEAAAGRKPWLRHFYLAHGVGTDSAEMPLLGTDLGPEFDERIVLAPGMVLVLEPVIWDDGECGYRSEDIVAVTDSGYETLSDFPYGPFG